MLKDRLKKARFLSGLSQTELAKAANVSQSTIVFLENGRNENSKHLVEIASALGVSAEWLKNGGELIPIQNKENKDGQTISDEIIGMDAWDDNTPLQSYEVELPFFKDMQLSAGNGCFELLDYEGRKLRFSKRTLKDNGVDPSKAICVTAKGDSMEPVIPDKCTVAIDLGDKEINDGQIYAINNDGLLQIKILKWITGSEISIESYNPTYSPSQRKLSEVEIIGRVFWYSVLLKK